MSFKKWGAWVCAFLLICVATAGVNGGGGGLSAQARSAQPQAPEIEFVTAQELKAKLDRNEPVTIIDVRATNTYIGSDVRIKGAIHVKSRRLRARLTLPPLRDVPRDSEVVIYCACPSDEASIRAAQVLVAAGFKRVRALKGGWSAWLKSSGQVEPRPKG